MDFKTNTKYFSKANHLFTIIGAVIIVLGVLAATGGRFMLMFGLGVAVVGLAIIIISLGSRLKDEDIDTQTEKKTQDVMDMAKDKLDILGKDVKLFQPMNIGAFGYEEMDQIFFKKGADGKERTSVFVNTSIYFSNDMLYASRYMFCLTEEKEDTTLFKAKYTDLKKAELVEHTFTPSDGGQSVPYYMFVITTDKGTEFKFPMRNDADADKLAENINYQIKKLKTIQE